MPMARGGNSIRVQISYGIVCLFNVVISLSLPLQNEDKMFPPDNSNETNTDLLFPNMTNFLMACLFVDLKHGTKLKYSLRLLTK